MCEYTDQGLIIESLEELEAILLQVGDKDFRIVFQPLNPLEELSDGISLFGRVCDYVYSLGDMTFACEELDTFLCLNASGLENEFLQIIQRGRHANIEFIGITQRPFAIPAIVRSQAKIVYTFKQIEPRDIDFLKYFMGEGVEIAKGLPNYHYLKWDNGQIEKGMTQKNERIRKITPPPDTETLLDVPIV